MSFKRFLSGSLAAFLSVEQNHSCNFESGHHGKHSCEVILILGKWFRRRCHLKKRFMDDGLTTDAGRRPITIPHLEPLAQGSQKGMQVIEVHWLLLIFV